VPPVIFFDSPETEPHYRHTPSSSSLHPLQLLLLLLLFSCYHHLIVRKKKIVRVAIVKLTGHAALEV
jgi:hypothetical protein